MLAAGTIRGAARISTHAAVIAVGLELFKHKHIAFRIGGSRDISARQDVLDAFYQFIDLHNISPVDLPSVSSNFVFNSL
jgi:hypothetical protein